MVGQPRVPRSILVAWSVLLVPMACAPTGAPQPTDAETPVPSFACDPDNGGLSLPDGFCAVVFADEVGAARHLAVSASGDLYVAHVPSYERTDEGRRLASPGGVQAMRDTDGDGKADLREAVNEIAGTGIALHDGYLYYSSNLEIFRVAVVPGELVPSGEPELLVSGFPDQSQHASKPLAFDTAGNMYVTVGAPSNACQQPMRTPGSAGLDPCPQRDLQAGIWRFDAARPGQTQADGVRYATGIRNAVAIEWDEPGGGLFALQHGRDSLHDLWSDLYTLEQSAEIPAEEMLKIAEGDDFGWPYCYFDPPSATKVLAPEYGGDGAAVGRCADATPALTTFPAHWAPNDLIFYRGGSFPAHYEGGAFVAFHGSWNRMPFPQQGYNVVFIPFADGRPSADYEVFADGFAGMEEINLQEAQHRPTGLAQGPDGSLYVASDFRSGRIWRIRALGP